MKASYFRQPRSHDKRESTLTPTQGGGVDRNREVIEIKAGK